MTHEINIADFAAFCRSKGEETFDPWDCRNCALAQFGRSVFPDADVIGGFSDIELDGVIHDVPGLCVGVIADHPGSFSALADRLEALAEQSHA